MSSCNRKPGEIEERFWESDKFHYESQEFDISSTTNETGPKGNGAITEQPYLKRRRKVSAPRESECTGPHPLLIDHVIEKILDYSCDFITSVKQFRLVCKQWCLLSTKKFRNTHGRICFENDFSRRTSKFIQVMQGSSEMLFDKFKFSGGFVLYKPYKGSYAFDKVFNELFKVCVPWMKSLEFTSHNPSDLKFPKNIKKYDLSHLSTLSFHICVFYNNLQLEMTDYLGSLLDAANSLRTLDFRLVSADPSMQSENQLKIIQTFGEVVATRIPTTVKYLKLNMLLNDNHFSLLEARNLNLECLIIDFQKGARISTKVIETFLKNQSKTLQNLEFIECNSLHDAMELPALPNLTFFKIEGRPRIPSFKFETAFPNLKSIEILFYWIYQDEDWLKTILVDSGSSKTVMDVEFLCEINERDLFVLYRLVRCFPMLQRLSVVLNTTGALTVLFTEMTFLQDLEISLAREFWGFRRTDRLGKVDCAFTGIPSELCVQLLRQNDYSNTDLPSTLCDSSIRDLKRLKKLKIRGYRADQIPLTDVTIHYGLLKMPNLKHLILDVFTIKESTLIKLGEHVKLQLLPGPPTLP